jgi:hypothetical protein
MTLQQLATSAADVDSKKKDGAEDAKGGKGGQGAQAGEGAGAVEREWDGSATVLDLSTAVVAHLTSLGVPLRRAVEEGEDEGDEADEEGVAAAAAAAVVAMADLCPERAACLCFAPTQSQLSLAAGAGAAAGRPRKLCEALRTLVGQVRAPPPSACPPSHHIYILLIHNTTPSALPAPGSLPRRLMSATLVCGCCYDCGQAMVHVLTSGDVAVGALADLAEAATRLGRGPDAAAAGGSRRQADEDEDEEDEDDDDEEDGEESAQVSLLAHPCAHDAIQQVPLRLVASLNTRSSPVHPPSLVAPLRCCCSTPASSCCP